MLTPRFVDLHIIQSLPPANLNRDDAGNPKQAIYGGVRRLRASSQAWKRAARKYTADRQGGQPSSIRTKRLVNLVAPLVAERAQLSAERAEQVTTAVVSATGITMDKKNPAETSYLLFFGRDQVNRAAELIAKHAAELAELSGGDLKTAAKDIDLRGVLGDGHPVDVALYGRMVADLAGLNVDAATQVAHAISTHPVEIEFDFYTAVDDENTEDETGAGMIGTVEFSSATLYRYATVGINQLAENLGDDAAVGPAIAQFIEAFVKSIPSGHQNSHAHGTRPALVAVICRDDQPVNLVNAFEKPVRVGEDGGVESGSLEALARFFREDSAQWGDSPAYVWANYAESAPGIVSEAFGAAVPFAQLLTNVASAVTVQDRS